ncbi:MAG: DinB family protein [Cytophagaceae bacterium]
MKKSDLTFLPEFFERYITQPDDEEMLTSLGNSLHDLYSIDLTALEQLGDKTYAEGKWTIKDILQHIIDNERIQAYRALRFARNDSTAQPGYDENLLADNADTSRRTVKDLLDELITIRNSTVILFENLTDEMLLRTGMASGIKVSVLALGFVIAGHQQHHLKVIREKYLPLA